MRCFCSSPIPDCPPGRQIECDKGVSHCILSLRYDNGTNRFVESLLECWRWADVCFLPQDAQHNREFVTSLNSHEEIFRAVVVWGTCVTIALHCEWSS
ncbi:hypothetical protein FBUS_03478 [Fasciolopsis buskii]|uniref:Uncharacterized protein n=1 Tax=Fasciolopsis buskii TaxID=27845 RepID=A0A8E0S4E4_9TREM|nr:hypothetical protein FBUS_03478 [Fasciolopsis buski]